MTYLDLLLDRMALDPLLYVILLTASALVCLLLLVLWLEPRRIRDDAMMQVTGDAPRIDAGNFK